MTARPKRPKRHAPCLTCGAQVVAEEKVDFYMQVAPSTLPETEITTVKTWRIVLKPCGHPALGADL